MTNRIPNDVIPNTVTACQEATYPSGATSLVPVRLINHPHLRVGKRPIRRIVIDNTPMIEMIPHPKCLSRNNSAISLLILSIVGMYFTWNTSGTRMISSQKLVNISDNLFDRRDRDNHPYDNCPCQGNQSIPLTGTPGTVLDVMDHQVLVTRLTVAFVIIAHGATTAHSEHGLGTFGDRLVITDGDRTSEIVLLAVTILTSGFIAGTDHPDDEITGFNVHDVSSLIALVLCLPPIIPKGHDNRTPGNPSRSLVDGPGGEMWV